MRSPTDRSKSNHRSPKEQPLQVRPLTANPAQSSPARDSLTTFATGVCQSETARSFKAPDANKPQKPTRNAKADFTTDSTPTDSLRWVLKSQVQHSPSPAKSQQAQHCPKSSRKPTSPHMSRITVILQPHRLAH
jgi:hypothetical protein